MKKIVYFNILSTWSSEHYHGQLFYFSEELKNGNILLLSNTERSIEVTSEKFKEFFKYVDQNYVIGGSICSGKSYREVYIVLDILEDGGLVVCDRFANKPLTISKEEVSRYFNIKGIDIKKINYPVNYTLKDVDIQFDFNINKNNDEDDFDPDDRSSCVYPLKITYINLLNELVSSNLQIRLHSSNISCGIQELACINHLCGDFMMRLKNYSNNEEKFFEEMVEKIFEMLMTDISFGFIIMSTTKNARIFPHLVKIFTKYKNISHLDVLNPNSRNDIRLWTIKKN